MEFNFFRKKFKVECIKCLNKRDMIDAEIWSRWRGLAKTIMTISKFKESMG